MLAMPEVRIEASFLVLIGTRAYMARIPTMVMVMKVMLAAWWN